MEMDWRGHFLVSAEGKVERDRDVRIVESADYIAVTKGSERSLAHRWYK